MNAQDLVKKVKMQRLCGQKTAACFQRCVGMDAFNAVYSTSYEIDEKYGTHFTEMDKVLVQMENDYANQEKWQSYAKNNDRATFMLLFEKDFPNMAADRYEQNDQIIRKLFDDPDMMKQVMETVGSVLYERLKKKYIFDPKSGVIEEATPETYVEDTYLTEK